MAKYIRRNNYFMAVAGEEQGLLCSTYAAEQAKQKAWMSKRCSLTTSSGIAGGNGIRDAHTVRVFSKEATVKPEEATVRRGRRRERFGSAPAGRFIKETAERYVSVMRVMMVYRRDRYPAAASYIPFLERARPSGLLSRMKTIVISTRMFA